MQQYDKGFKQDAVNYLEDHPEISIAQCAKNLGVNANTLHNCLSKARKDEEFRGQGHYSSDEAKEIAGLKHELTDTGDALEILKITSKYRGSKEEIVCYDIRI